MTARQVTADELPLLQPLIASYPFKPYRHYRMLARRAQQAVMLAEIRETLEHPDGVVLVAEQGQRRGAIVARRLAWDTSFFGVAMGRIEYVLGDVAMADALVADALAALARRGIQHCAARADVADIERVAVLERHGFRLMDALVTYITRPGKEPPHAVREVGTIRPFEASDGPDLLAIAAEAYGGFRGRFHVDPHLPDDRCDAFYVEWARQCVNTAMADTILVSEGGDGRLLGFLAFRRREPVSSAGGVPLFGGGLGACRTDTPGAYAGLIRAGTLWAHERGGVAECQTQNYNFPTVRIYEAVGAHYVRAEYTLHAWLG